MSVITERKLRTLFADEGYRVLEIRSNRHWVAKVAKEDGGRPLTITVSRTPSGYFQDRFVQSIRRAERAAAERVSLEPYHENGLRNG
jgi:hypothetical protein